METGENDALGPDSLPPISFMGLSMVSGDPFELGAVLITLGIIRAGNITSTDDEAEFLKNCSVKVLSLWQDSFCFKRRGKVWKPHFS